MFLVLCKEMRDDIVANTSFVQQETFFLWENYFSECSSVQKGMLSFGEFVEFLKDNNFNVGLAESLFGAFDLNEDGELSFFDWVKCIDKSCRGTMRDMTYLASRALNLAGGDKDQVKERAEMFLEQRGMELEDLDEEIALIMKVVKNNGLESVAFQNMNSRIFECVSQVIIGVFSPCASDMERKLKRSPMQSLNVVCLAQETRMPVVIKAVCERLREIKRENAACIDFLPQNLYKQRALVEAVTNAYTYGWVSTDGLSCEVLLMVLRTYLRLFTEPLYTLHLARDLLFRGSQKSENMQVAILREALEKLPVNYRETLRTVVECASELFHDEKSLDTLTRILSYCIIRNEVKKSSTSPVSLELTKVLFRYGSRVIGKE